MSRTYNTLFLLESLDGKISTGNIDNLDFDKDLKRIHGIKEGLNQYYKIEQTTDLYSLNSGRVMAKIGVNTQKKEPVKTEISFIIIDNKHLKSNGVKYLAKWVKTLYLVTSNKSHPAFSLVKKYSNIKIINYKNEINFIDLFSKLKKFNIDRITIQSGGNLNSQFLRLGLIDEISIVIAPCLVGGENTQSLIGGESLHTEKDLAKIKPLKLIKCDVLNNSYVHLKYEVVNKTVIDKP